MLSFLWFKIGHPQLLKNVSLRLHMNFVAFWIKKLLISKTVTMSLCVFSHIDIELRASSPVKLHTRKCIVIVNLQDIDAHGRIFTIDMAYSFKFRWSITYCLLQKSVMLQTL